MKFKVSDRVEVVKANEHKNHYDQFIGQTSQIESIDMYGGEYPYKLSFNDVQGVPGSYWSENELKLAEKTMSTNDAKHSMDNLQVGDILVDKFSEYTVVAILENTIFFLINSDGVASEPYSLKELKESYTLKDAEPAIKEMTVADVEKLVGSKVKIVK